MPYAADQHMKDSGPKAPWLLARRNIDVSKWSQLVFQALFYATGGCKSQSGKQFAKPERF